MANAAFLREARSAVMAEEGGVSTQEEDAEQGVAHSLKCWKFLFMVLNSTVLSIRHAVSHLILEEPYEVDTVTSLILQRKRLGHRDIKRRAQGHRATEWQSQDLNHLPFSYLQSILKFCGFHLLNLFRMRAVLSVCTLTSLALAAVIRLQFSR